MEVELAPKTSWHWDTAAGPTTKRRSGILSITQTQASLEFAARVSICLGENVAMIPD